MNSFTVEFPAGRFDIDLCVGSGQVFRWARQSDGVLAGVDGKNWYRVLDSPRPAQQRNALTYVAEDRTADAAPETLRVDSNATKSEFVDLFRLDWDADAIEKKILRLAPEMAPYLGALNGLRLVHPSDPVELFFSFLCTPNNNLARIKKMVAHLASYGEGIEFPRTARIAGIPEAELRAAGFGYRAATIPAIARQVLDRGGDAWILGLVNPSEPDMECWKEPQGLATLPYVAARDQLLAIKGIGPKLADCICLFALNYTEATPIDTHLWQALSRVYFPEWKHKPLTDARYDIASTFLRNKFGVLAGWAHQHLFYDNLLNWRGR